MYLLTFSNQQIMSRVDEIDMRSFRSGRGIVWKGSSEDEFSGSERVAGGDIDFVLVDSFI